MGFYVEIGYWVHMSEGMGNPLAARWLGPGALIAQGTSLIPGQGLDTAHMLKILKRKERISK